MTERTTSNPDFDKEKAEGERETVEQSLDTQAEQGQGITNRPLEDEEKEQASLPPRGQAKQPDGGHA